MRCETGRLEESARKSPVGVALIQSWCRCGASAGWKSAHVEEILYGSSVGRALESHFLSRVFSPKNPNKSGIVCERFHKTVLNEFYRVTFRKKLYHTLDELQSDLDLWLKRYNEERPPQGRWCYGKTPMQTFVDSIPLAKEKMIAA